MSEERKTRAGGFMTWGQLLKFIDEYYKREGLCPTYREMMAAMGVASTSTIAHHISYLLSRGLVTRKDNSPRTLLVTEKGKELLGRET